MARSTDCVRCGGTGIMSKAPEGGVSCWYCKGTGKRAWLLTQNHELRPMGIYNWTLPAFVVQLSNGKHMNVCPNAGICASVCYALNGTYKFPSVRQAHVNKLEMTLYDGDGWEAVMTAELQHPRYQGKWVRIHDGGDFYSADYLRRWLRIVAASPGVTFYAYTKEVTMFREVVEQGSTVNVLPGPGPAVYAAQVPLDTGGMAQYNADHPEAARRGLLAAAGTPIPENFLYIYSMGGKEDRLLDLDVDRHAEIFENFDVMHASGYDDQEEDDRDCVRNRNTRVGIVQNNIPAFKKKLAGRTFGQMQEERDDKRRTRLEALASDPATAEPSIPVIAPSAPEPARADVEPHSPPATYLTPEGGPAGSDGEPTPLRASYNMKPDLPTVPDDQGTLF